MRPENQNGTSWGGAADTGRSGKPTPEYSQPRPEVQEHITVLDVRRINAGNLRAFVSIQIDRMIVHSCRVIQQPGKAAWVSLPQQERDGKYFPIVECSDRQLADKIKAEILKAYNGKSRNSEEQI